MKVHMYGARYVAVLRAVQDGAKTTRDIAQVVGCSTSTAHHHLMILHNLGIVRYPEGVLQLLKREVPLP